MAPMWTVHGDGKTIRPDTVVSPDERLSWPRTIGIGAQHVVAMFGATFLVPLLTHFPPSTTLLFSGVGTIGFLLITRNRLPSYLGSSFAFIAPITAAMAGHGMGGALFGILAVGILLAIVGGIVILTGTGWIDALMPPIVAGAIVALIGFNLAPTAVTNFSTSPLVAVITLAAIILCTVLFRGMLGRMSIFVGVVIGFPLGATLSASKRDEAARVVKLGAHDVDMVLNIGLLKSATPADYEATKQDIRGVVEIAHGAGSIVKVILETCLLSYEEKLRASELALSAGADFLKTSTGFSTGGATVDDIALLRSIAGSRAGVKASGGIRSLADATAMLKAGASRIGASASVRIVTELAGQPQEETAASGY